MTLPRVLDEFTAANRTIVDKPPISRVATRAGHAARETVSRGRKHVGVRSIIGTGARRANSGELRESNPRVRPLSKLSMHDMDIEHALSQLLRDFHHLPAIGISPDAMEFAEWRRQNALEIDMGESGRLEPDPVCGMMVDEWALQLVHHGVGYAFCSPQCRERFDAAPGLYVGRHSLLAPKQKGMEVIKRRRMLLGKPLTQAQFVELNDALLSMMGVTAVRSVEPMADSGPDLQRTEGESRMAGRIEVLEITYDLLQATALQLERKIVERNATLSNRWGQKLLRDCIHYFEHCELEDLAIRPAAQVECEPRTRHAASSFQRTV